MSSILHILPSNSLETIQSYATRNPSRTGLIASAALLSLTLPWLIDNYRKFVDLGEFGIKSKPLGYVFAMLIHPFGSETTSTTMYDNDPNQETWIRDPDSIPERRGDRPKTGWHSAPHRQINKIPSEDMKKVRTTSPTDHHNPRLSDDGSYSSVWTISSTPYQRNTQHS